MLASEAKPFLHSSADGQLGIFSRNAKALAEYPHAASAIVNLINPRAHSPERVGDPSGDADLSASPPPGTALDLSNVLSPRTARQHHHHRQEQHSRENFIFDSMHEFPPFGYCATFPKHSIRPKVAPGETYRTPGNHLGCWRYSLPPKVKSNDIWYHQRRSKWFITVIHAPTF